jgi:large subunit ribosomal protein L21
MFAVVRTGGKQYRVAPGDKIVVEKLAGEAGDQITLGDVLLAGEGGNFRSTDGLTVAAEILAQAKGDKVTVFKKRRRHNYRRKKGHRQQHTILKIVAIGDHKAPKAAPKTESKPAKAESKPAQKSEAPAAAAPEKSQTPAAHAKAKGNAEAAQQDAGSVSGTPTENPAPNNQKSAGAEGAKAKKAAPAAAKAKTPSTKNAAPAKAAAKKTPKAK